MIMSNNEILGIIADHIVFDLCAITDETLNFARSIERAVLEKVKAADHIVSANKMVAEPYRYIVGDKCFETESDAEHFQRSAQAMYRGKVEVVPVYREPNHIPDSGKMVPTLVSVPSVNHSPGVGNMIGDPWEIIGHVSTLLENDGGEFSDCYDSTVASETRRKIKELISACQEVPGDE